MRRGTLRVAAGAALLAAAVLAAVLAVDTWRLPGAVAAEDGLLAGTRPPAGAWAHGQGLRADLTGAVDDATYRRAVALFLRGRPDDPAGERSTEQIVSSIEAGIALAGIARGDGPVARRSQALNLQAILIGELAIFEPDGGPRIDAAADLLRRAIRLDPRNDAAKANLELLLGITGVGGADTTETGGVGGFGEESGAGEAGSGY
ncbi:MAG TPA: hypothetical protein VFR43_00940 [Gaiellaceae bacterium]|nr:hypothetical protein [Gaiellaceae bacterium]